MLTYNFTSDGNVSQPPAAEFQTSLRWSRSVFTLTSLLGYRWPHATQIVWSETNFLDVQPGVTLMYNAEVSKFRINNTMSSNCVTALHMKAETWLRMNVKQIIVASLSFSVPLLPLQLHSLGHSISTEDFTSYGHTVNVCWEHVSREERSLAPLKFTHCSLSYAVR